MNLEKLKPWNWFKSEDARSTEVLPVQREQSPSDSSTLSGASMMPLAHELDRLFDSLFPRSRFVSNLERTVAPSLFGSNSPFCPALDLATDNDGYTITLEAPGLTDKDLQIELQGRCLVISGYKTEERESKDKGHYYRMERQYGRFQRILNLPDDALTDQIDAKMRHGVLTVRIPRNQRVESGRKIEIGQS